MENLLLLVHRIPYPPNKGDKIRSYHLLKHLGQRYRVHLGTFIDDADDWQYVPSIKALCASSHFAPLNPTTARIRCLGGLLTNRSLSLGYYHDSGLQDWVDQAMEEYQIDRVLVFSSAMAQYVEHYPEARRVADFVDVDSDKWRQYAEKKSWPMSWLYRHEAVQLLRYERKVALEFDASLFVSAQEAGLFRQLAPESAAKIGFFNNGVDTDYFSPHNKFKSPYPAGTRNIVFTGAMDYWPNIDAVQWFALEVFPALLASFSEVRFIIVGARPAAEVQALAQMPGITVTGTVPDVRPFISHAAIAVAPLRVARGIQNKVLEAMAMAKTIVVSPQALEGIDAVQGTELLLAADANEFIAILSALIGRVDGVVGIAARAKVEHRYSWSSNLARVDDHLESARTADPNAYQLAAECS